MSSRAAWSIQSTRAIQMSQTEHKIKGREREGGRGEREGEGEGKSGGPVQIWEEIVEKYRWSGI